MNLKKLQGTIEKIGENLRPDDDWMPALIVEGKKEVTIFGFIGEPLSSQQAKDVVARKITECIAQFNPECACFITTAWSIETEKTENFERDIEAWRRGTMKLSEHPNRIEVVNAYVYGVSGPNKGEVFMIGYIERSKDRGPKIKKWKIITDGATAEGRFPDAVKQGFQLAAHKEGG